MMLKRYALVSAAALLLMVNWLAFHDIHEPHTFRDYLMLAGSAMFFVYVGLEVIKIILSTLRTKGQTGPC